MASLLELASSEWRGQVSTGYAVALAVLTALSMACCYWIGGEAERESRRKHNERRRRWMEFEDED
jgi:uncharacterized protein (UPF0333 family)